MTGLVARVKAAAMAAAAMQAGVAAEWERAAVREAPVAREALEALDLAVTAVGSATISEIRAGRVRAAVAATRATAA